MRKVAILVPPFASLEFPSLEAAVLASVVNAAGDVARTVYASHLFAELLGTDRYTQIANVPPPRGLADYVGIGRLRQTNFPADTVGRRTHSSFAEYISASCGEGLSKIDYESVSMIWDRYAELLPDEPVFADVDVLILVVRHQQLGASLRLAPEFRGRVQNLRIIAVGQQIASLPQAEALLCVSPSIDGVIYSGGPSTLEQSYERILALEPSPGFVTRNGSASKAIERRPVGNLVAAPDFGQFYKTWTVEPIASVIPFQGSHGCWWADHQQCTFCGLIEHEQSYVEKPAAAAIQEFRLQVSRHESLRIVAADHLLSKSYFDQVLPELAQIDWDVTFFFEVKPTLSKAEIHALRDARVLTVEAGIESFDGKTLSDMRKGATPLINIRFLKWAQEIGIRVFWTLLYNLPGESEHQLSCQIGLLRQLAHLQPPLHATRARLERNSPIFKSPKDFGIRDVWPTEAVLHTYPFSLHHLNGLSRFFDFEGDSFLPAESAVEAELQETIKLWQCGWRTDLLHYKVGIDFIKIIDSRTPGETRITTLRDWRAKLYLDLDNIKNVEALVAKYAKANDLHRSEVESFLVLLTEEGLVYIDGDAVIGLAPRLNLLREHHLRYSKSLPSANPGSGN